jgi:hypothetical protein
LKYPPTFGQDMRELSAFYQWSEADKKEVRAAFTNCEPMVRYFTVLAAAHRAGYSQHSGNGFQRLKSWCAENGLPDPFGLEFDVAALDALIVDQRALVA